MDGRIGHLHCRYQLIGGGGSASAAPMILDRLARERVAESYAEALGKALGDSPAVYVVRRVSAPTLFAAKANMADPRLERLWGERLAGAVLRNIAEGDYNPDNVVTFADQADYVAHFVADLIEDVAWDRWFYGAFKSLRPLSTAEALRRVLIDNRGDLPAVLGRLHRDRTLDKVLSLLDGRSRRTVWEEGIHSLPAADREALRPIFAYALHLIDRLDLWAQPRRSREEMFQVYLAAKPLEADWRDRRGLTAAVFDAVSFFAGREWLRRGDAPDDDFQARLDRALAEFDWVDVDWLRTALSDLLRGTVAPDHDLPSRPASLGATPRQRELLTELVAALREERLRVDLSEAEIPANALKLYAALVSRAPQWADDPAAFGMIRQTLTAWSYLRQSDSIAETMRCLRERDIAGALRTLPEPARENAEPVFRFLTALGDRASPLLEGLAEIDQKTAWSNVRSVFEAGKVSLQSDARSQSFLERPVERDQKIPLASLNAYDEIGVETDCAGVALLLRAIADARLNTLVEETHLQSSDSLAVFPAVLLALGMRWGGENATTQSRVDEGLCLMAGLRQPPDFGQLREVWSKATAADCSRLQSALMGVLVGQRLVQTSALRLFRIAVEPGREAVIAGDETALLWPMGRVIEPDTALEQIVVDLVNAWVEIAGRKPSAIVADDSLAEIVALHVKRGELIVASGEDRSSESATQNTGKRALLDAMGALNRCRLDLPNVDLTMGLAAAALLRMWARWLRRFADSSIPFLLDNFIDRRGRVRLSDDALLVELERRPLDIVIEMAGYAADLEHVAWLGGRSVRFRR